jgi:hypothetical protein
VDSEVIRLYGILNDQVGRDDAFLEGIPYPGVYVTDEHGVVVAKFFHDTYKKRDSPEFLIDAALGRLENSNDEPRVRGGGGGEVDFSVSVHGGKGTIRQGICRQLVVHCELEEGFHLYGQPAPSGLVPTEVRVSGPPGLVVEEPIFPPTEILRLESMGVELPVWTGSLDILVPFYATGELASETRPLDTDSVELEVEIRYQACSHATCSLPKTETLKLPLKLDVVDVPDLGLHRGHGQREGNFSGGRHMTRLVLRKFRKNPVGLLRFMLKSIRLEIGARRRSRSG